MRESYYERRESEREEREREREIVDGDKRRFRTVEVTT